MLETIKNVMKKKNEIIKRTREYQNFNLKDSASEDGYKNNKLEMDIDAFFDTFTDNEVMVIQSIMYLGRDHITGDSPTDFTNVIDLMNEYFQGLGFKLDKKIDKAIEINQMVEKGLRIGDYFRDGFKIVESCM